MDKPAMPPTPELDKMKEISDKSQIIGEFLDWFFFSENVIPFTYDWHEWEEKCSNCKGLGTYKEGEPPPDDNELRQVHEMLHLVPPATLGTQCTACKGEGLKRRQREEEVELPVNINYWLEKFYDIDGAKAERERTKVLEYVRALNDWRDQQDADERESADDSGLVGVPDVRNSA